MSVRILTTSVRFVIRLLVLGSLVASTASVADAAFVDKLFTMDEFSWNVNEGVEFVTTHVPGEGNNSWGKSDETDTYAQVPSGSAFTDIFLPPDQLSTPNEGGFILSFDTQYMTTSAGQSYVAFGSVDDLDLAVWFGFGSGNTFLAGTGSELDLSGNEPSGVTIDFETEATYENDTRIGLRFGFDIDAQTLRNFQVDHDNDGTFDDELITEAIDISGAGLAAEDWVNVSYFGKGGTRVDDIFIKQVTSLKPDFNGDLDFDGEDVDLICSGIAQGDITFDLNGDGEINIADRDSFINNFNSLVGDFDYDGAVAFADFLVLSTNFGLAGTNSNGDADCNGTVGFADFLIMSSFFGSQVGAQPVPEPTSASLIAGAALLLAASSRRRRR